MSITHLKINGIACPLGYEPGPLLLSWQVEGVVGDQANAAITVWQGEPVGDPLWETAGDLAWEGTPIAITPLPRTRYTVRVEVTDDQGGVHSGDTWFETGKLGEDWQAKWLGIEGEPQWAPVLSGSFTAEKEVAAARLYMVGLGVYDAHINGEKLSDELLAPGLWYYEKETQYQTYDVTGLMAKDNTLSVTLGNGWYKGRFGLDGRLPYGDKYALLAELRITYADGSTQVFCSDESWTWNESDIGTNSIYDGEVINRLAHENGENARRPVILIDAPLKLVDRISPPITEALSLPVMEVIHTPAGETVLDFGQNHAGWLRFKSHLPKGTTVHFDFGEVLQKGSFYNDNYRSAIGGFTYTSDGREETVTQHFTFYGFRYVRVVGWPGEVDDADFDSPVIHTQLDRTGWLTTGHTNLNRLYENTIWGQRSNFLSVPTDCPQRDERLGWTGDAQVFSPTACYNMDCRAFYRSFLRLLRLDQLDKGGAVTSCYPSANLFDSCAIWSDACAIIPSVLMSHSGSAAEIAEHYPMMRDWVDFVAKNYPNFLYEQDQLGDWLALDGVTEQSFKGATDDVYLGTVYWMNSARIVADLAHRLGRTEDAAKYSALAENIRRTVMEHYVTPVGRLSVDTQAGYINALKFGLWNDKDVLLQQFMRRMRFDGFQIRCGFAAAPIMCSVLAEHGMSDLACDLLLQRGFPGWMYAVELGATTIWERWNSLLPDGTCSGTGMNSLNHYSYGSVMEYVYGYLAGVRPGGHGFRSAVIAPNPDIRVGYVNCTLDTVAGKYVVNWNIGKDGQLSVHIEVPFGCTAAVTLPRSGKVTFTLSAGSYDYSYMPQQDYRSLYSLDTRLGKLAEDERAKAILGQEIPMLLGLLMSGDREICAQTFRELSTAFFMGLNEDNIGRLVNRLSELKYE